MVWLLVLLALLLHLFYKQRTKHRFCLYCSKCGRLIPANENLANSTQYNGYMPKVCPHCGSLRYNVRSDTYDYLYASAKSNFNFINPITWFVTKYEVIEVEEE